MPHFGFEDNNINFINMNACVSRRAILQFEIVFDVIGKGQQLHMWDFVVDGVFHGWS